MRRKPRQAFALLVLGVNPLRAVDEPYRSFVRHMSNALCSSLLTARNIDRERQRAKELEQLGKAKTAFFHNVSHEFRTPLTLTLGPLQEVLEDSDKLSDSHREALQTAMRNGKRLLKLVNSILDFARLEAGTSANESFIY